MIGFIKQIQIHRHNLYNIELKNICVIYNIRYPKLLKILHYCQNKKKERKLQYLKKKIISSQFGYLHAKKMYGQSGTTN